VLSGLILACPAADAQGTATTSTLTLTGSQPYNLSCSVSGVQVSGAGPTGTVTFTDVTTGQTLATETLGSATFARGFLDSVFQLPGSGSAADAAVGDFNGDGIPDLINADSSDIYVFLGNGDGTFQPAITTPISVSSSVNLIYGIDDLVTGDFNNDGKLDIVVDVEGQLVFFPGNGNGTFATGTP